MTMSETPATPVTGAPTRGLRRSALDRPVAMGLAATEYRRYLAQLRTLDDADWSRPTDCPAWDVRALATHNLGMAAMVTSMRELVRQNAVAARQGTSVDALTALQVRERAAMRPDHVVEAYAAVVTPAVRGRRRRAATMGRLPMPVTQSVNGADERWSFGYLFDTILTRDTWMHRVDTGRATGKAMELTAEHDGVLVADVVAEWAARHGAPCVLTLTGPAGGRWSFGAGGPALTLDAVEFCRTVSGRVPGDGLLSTAVPF